MVYNIALQNAKLFIETFRLKESSMVVAILKTVLISFIRRTLYENIGNTLIQTVTYIDSIFTK